MILTEIHEEYEGDTYFPEYDKEEWREEKRDSHEGLDFVEYRRVT